VPIFMGEVRQAPGTLSDIAQCCEVILFTSAPEALQAIVSHDWIERVAEQVAGVDSHIEERPSTASHRPGEEPGVSLSAVPEPKPSEPRPSLRETEDKAKAQHRDMKPPEKLERPYTTATTSKQMQQSLKEQMAQKDRELATLAQEEKRKADALHSKEVMVLYTL
jgi:hypothetical protein